MSRNFTVLTIASIRLLSALPFAIFYSSLELYLLSINFHNSTALVGSVLALSFGLSLLGGYLGGRFLSYKSLFLTSILFQAIGCFVFATHNHEFILWLSSLFLLGSIGNTVSLNMMLTQLFKPNEHDREKAFFVLYMCLNLGYLIGYSLAGYFANINQYAWLPFIILCTSCSAALVIFIFWKKLDSIGIVKKQSFSVKLVLIFAGSFILLRLLLEHPYITNSTLVLLWLVLITFMYIYMYKKQFKNRVEVNLFYLLLFSALVFWSVYLLAPMALMVFLKSYVNLKIGSLVIAPQWIQNINTVIIIAGSIWFSFNIKNNSAGYLKRQFAKGMLLMSAGFFVLILGIIFNSGDKPISIVWIILSYILQSWGELFIGPIGYSLVGKFVPESYQSIMTGIWATVLGVASAIASFLSSSVVSTNHQFTMSLSKFNYLFVMMSVITILVSILLFYKKPNFS